MAMPPGTLPGAPLQSMVIQHHGPSYTRVQCIHMGSSPPHVHVNTSREFISQDVIMDATS